MKIKENICICSTAFHIFNILNMCTYEITFKDTDLLLLDWGKKVSTQLNIEYLKSLFNKVYIISLPNKRNYIKLIKHLVVGKILKKYVYKKIFVYGTEIYSRLFSLDYYKKDISEIFYFEDGLASYGRVLNIKSKAKKDIGIKILYGKSHMELCSGLFVYEPSCVMNNTLEKKVFPIKKILSKDVFKNLNISSCFVSNPKQNVRKIVFFESWFTDFEKYNKQKSLIEMMICRLDVNKICIKKHPSDVNNFSIEQRIEVIEDLGNFELYNLEHDVTNNIFISIISSACLTPKLIYNQEPTIILLYKIFRKKEDWIIPDGVIQKIRKTYSIPEKVMIPESISEYEECLGKIKNYL